MLSTQMDRTKLQALANELAKDIEGNRAQLPQDLVLQQPFGNPPLFNGDQK